MGVYVVTGSGSGMGRSTAEHLRWNGHRVIGVDLRNADVIADLSTHEGRQSAINEVLSQCNGRLEGAIMAAGLGPIVGREKLIAQVNYYGVVDLLEGFHDALAAAGNAKVVIFSSNSTTSTPGLPNSVVDAFLADDVDLAVERARAYGEQVSPTFVYAGSKTAVTHWMRTIGVTQRWAGQGIRVNAIAPGAILTPLLQSQLADPKTGAAIQNFPIPVGGFGKPEEVAEWVIFMLSPAANFLCGALIFLDGGTDAYFRANDWPVALDPSRVPEYQQRMSDFAAEKAALEAEREAARKG